MNHGKVPVESLECGTNHLLFGFPSQAMPFPYGVFRIGVIAGCSTDLRQGDFFRLGQDQIRKPPAKKPVSDAVRDREMGSALRSVYQKTVDEDIPDDLLDLLGKLG